MASNSDDSSLLSDQDINRFLIMVGIEPQISITSVLENKILAILPIKWLKTLPSLWLYLKMLKKKEKILNSF